MKNFNFLTKSLLVLFLFSLLSCEKEPVNDLSKSSSSQDIPIEIVAKISELSFNHNEVTKKIVTDIDGTKKRDVFNRRRYSIYI